MRDSGGKACGEAPIEETDGICIIIEARLVIIVGPREIKENKVRFRDMKTG
jgi:hypothetical protein